MAQFTVIENGSKRRADVVLFVNGLPLAVIELKNGTNRPPSPGPSTSSRPIRRRSPRCSAPIQSW
nr:type I restriction endonuclease [uncultured Thiodictyon sp.]